MSLKGPFYIITGAFLKTTCVIIKIIKSEVSGILVIPSLGICLRE